MEKKTSWVIQDDGLIHETVEGVKKEADELMINKIIKYEKDITKLKKEICELRQDNKKLSQQVEDSIDRMRKAGVI